MGPGVDPTGEFSDYLITPSLGEQVDKTLFHSFESFGLASGEVATFTGPDAVDAPVQSVSQVVSRVTGGSTSLVDGTIRSTIPGAAVYLLNPSGWIFGETARLDVPGAFYVSTGDALGFENGGEFSASETAPPPLLAVEPGVFSFLEGNWSSILVDHSAELAAKAIGLEASDRGIVRIEGTLSATQPAGDAGLITLSAGAIQLAGGRIQADAYGARGGQIRIRGDDVVLEEGEILARGWGSELGGTVRIEGDRVFVGRDASADGSEGMRIAVDSFERGGTLIIVGHESVSILPTGTLSARAFGRGNGGSIILSGHDVFMAGSANAGTIETTDHGGLIQITATGEVRVDGSLSVAVFGAGSAGTVEVVGMQVDIDGSIDAGPTVFGSGGSIDLESTGSDSSVRILGSVGAPDSSPGGARSVSIRGANIEAVGARIRADGFLGVPAGDVSIIADDSVSFSSESIIRASTDLRSEPGANGLITIEAKRVSVTGGSRIESNGIDNTSAGTIFILGTESIEILGSGTAIVVISVSETERGGSARTGTGQAGFLRVHGADVRVADGAVLLSQGLGSSNDGEASALEVKATKLSVSGKGSSVLALGAPLRIVVVALQVSDGAAIGRPVLVSVGRVVNGGAEALTETVDVDVGDVTGGVVIEAGSLLLESGGAIVASTASAAEGGSIRVTADGTIAIRGDSSIESLSFAEGNGGGIFIQAETIVLDSGGINASSDGSSIDGAERPGDAGSIEINFDDELRMRSSSIATSTAKDASGGDIAINGGWTSDPDQGIVLGEFEISNKDGTSTLFAVQRTDQAPGFLVFLEDESNITASVAEGEGTGGNVLVDAQFIAIESGSIQARAAQDRGGNILLVADTVFANGDLDDFLDASSAGGPELSGTVEVQSPATEIAGTISALSAAFLDASSMMREQCAERRSGEASGSFKVSGRDGTPPMPGGLLSAPVLGFFDPQG